MATVSGVREEVVAVGDGRIGMRVQVRGEGPPLVYLHSAAGFGWDRFLEELATERTIYAPLVPGTSLADSEAIDEVRDLWELVLLEQEALVSLGLEGADMIGASFGGMLACEIQATFPGMFGKLVLLDPIGLWRDEHPVANWLLTPPQDLPALLFADPASPEVQAVLALPAEADARADEIALRTWSMGCTAKFVWPVPDRGLERRLHRIAAPTLVIWGEQDALVSCAYAQSFADGISGARVEILDGCGHVPQVERPEETLELVRGLLAEDRVDHSTKTPGRNGGEGQKGAVGRRAQGGEDHQVHDEEAAHA
jgi:pimeloyl-ACP methyl ester carboxylesterase